MPTEDFDVFAAFGVVEEVKPLTVQVPAITIETKEIEKKNGPGVPTIPGRRNEAPFSLQKLARDYTEEAFDVIRNIMLDEQTDASTRLEAAKQILDRGWGKATVQIKAEHARVDLNQLTTQLLEHKSEVDEMMAEAARIESEQFGQYITVDAVVAEESPSRSE